MNKLHFKLGVLLGFSIILNTANLINILYNIVIGSGVVWLVEGVIAVLIMFLCAGIYDWIIGGEHE